MQFDFLTPERQLSFDDVPAAPLNPEYDTTDLLTESPEFKAELAALAEQRQRTADEAPVRYVTCKYGYRASIDLPAGAGALHVTHRHLWEAVCGVRAKYAAWLEVSQTFGWDR